MTTTRTPIAEELEILTNALEYWENEGTDEEAAESGAESAVEMVQWCREDLEQLRRQDGAGR